VYAQSLEKSDDLRNSFYEELEQVFHDLPYDRMKFLLGVLMRKWG
jgi:hypothetical protein